MDGDKNAIQADAAALRVPRWQIVLLALTLIAMAVWVLADPMAPLPSLGPL